MEGGVLNLRFTKDAFRNEDRRKRYYRILHNATTGRDIYTILKDNIYIYYIPEEIAKYIYYKNRKVYIKENYPEELERKLYYCKYLIEIDFNYYLTYLKLSVIGGEIIGIRNNSKNKDTLIVITITNSNKISLFEQYSNILKNDKLQYIIENEICKGGKYDNIPNK